MAELRFRARAIENLLSPKTLLLRGIDSKPHQTLNNIIKEPTILKEEGSGLLRNCDTEVSGFSQTPRPEKLQL